MKQLFINFVFFFVFTTSLVNAQELDELNHFKYAIVGTLFYEDMAVDIYSISGNVRKHFLDKGFRVVSETKRYWPDELFGNPCLGIYCNISPTTGLFSKYKVEIEMKDCNGNVLYSGMGKGVGETETEAYHVATESALAAFDKLEYKYEPGNTIRLEEQLIRNKIEGLYDAIGISTALKIEISVKGSQIEARIVYSGDKKYQSGQLLASFTESSLSNNLYNVEWIPGGKGSYMTLASLEKEGGRLTIELKEDNEKKQLVFRKIE